MINPNIIISIPNIIEILNDIINTKTTTNALHNNLINLGLANLFSIVYNINKK